MTEQSAAKLVDASNCVYEFPSPPPGTGVNARVYYDGVEEEILDLDPNEGFFVPDASKPQVFQLAPGLCDLVKKGSDPALTPRNIAPVPPPTSPPPTTPTQPPPAGP